MQARFARFAECLRHVSYVWISGTPIYEQVSVKSEAVGWKA